MKLGKTDEYFFTSTVSKEHDWISKDKYMALLKPVWSILIDMG